MPAEHLTAAAAEPACAPACVHAASTSGSQPAEPGAAVPAQGPLSTSAPFLSGNPIQPHLDRESEPVKAERPCEGSELKSTVPAAVATPIGANAPVPADGALEPTIIAPQPLKSAKTGAIIEPEDSDAEVAHRSEVQIDAAHRPAQDAAAPDPAQTSRRAVPYVCQVNLMFLLCLRKFFWFRHDVVGSDGGSSAAIFRWFIDWRCQCGRWTTAEGILQRRRSTIGGIGCASPTRRPGR